jgi:hypothetical protein
MTYFHPQEEFQFQALYDYDEEHLGTRYLVEFPMGRVTSAATAPITRARTAGELDIEIDGLATTSSTKSRWMSSRRSRPDAAATAG